MTQTQDRLTEMIGPRLIQERIGELARQIDADFGASEPMFIGVLNGAFMFLSDLVRQLKVAPVIDFLRVASYGAATESTGIVQIRKDLEISIADRDVIVVEDIVDTGLTLDFLRRHLQAGNPRSLKICTLLDKPSRRRVALQPDYVGFTIEDRFVVGYGLDYAERHRQLPGIYVLEPAASP